MEEQKLISAETEYDANGNLTITIAGRLDYETVPVIWKQCFTSLKTTTHQVTLNAEKIDYCDSAGFAFLDILREKYKNNFKLKIYPRHYSNYGKHYATKLIAVNRICGKSRKYRSPI